MKKPASGNEPGPKQEQPAISEITVGGFKSIRDEQTIEIRPLTILAGPNSSGKSSIMQPLLLMKQTLERAGDPGVFWLDGPNVRFSAFKQLFSLIGGERRKRMTIGLSPLPNVRLVITYELSEDEKGIDVVDTTLTSNGKRLVFLRQGMTHEAILQSVPLVHRVYWKQLNEREEAAKVRWRLSADRCFLDANLTSEDPTEAYILSDFDLGAARVDPARFVKDLLLGIIHVPAPRGMGDRLFPRMRVANAFAGLFHESTASVIAHSETSDPERLETLSRGLARLELAETVTARIVGDMAVEILVAPKGRQGGPDELFNLSDVGSGVREALPVLTALIAAEDRMVYIEEPELHLHPRAQTVLAEILAEAAERGVRVVVETHSSLLLLAVQTLVAEGKLDPDLVKLHWFSLDDEGATRIHSGELDETGAFGEWPEDFGDVELRTQSRYLDAAEARQLGL